ncbi:MAG: TonB-dependent receptor [Flavobacteriaceae bacterium]|nr:TonB-dependent receptor [Flavobacteriaceae bacterium]|tara:strand:- start:10699 stop:13119 length:2421 start_codon:yes stop_codon:yes gene_type:complete
MKFKIFFILILSSYFIIGQENKVSGVVLNEDLNTPENNIKIYDRDRGFLDQTDEKGNFEFITSKENNQIIFLSPEDLFFEKKLKITNDTIIEIIFTPKVENLSEVILKANRIKAFQLKRLDDSKGTSIYAGKKNEIVLVAQTMANLAVNSSRQIYSQVAGLNIYENDDAGIQLHIGGRGLDPNRTSNFNTRQNNYDISADVLGYPESYYTPPAESLSEIQIIRGAASLQYGTQFGGLVNFIIQSPNTMKSLEITSRNTFGSNNLYTNYTSFSGTVNKLSYYSFVNYKKGDGFRDNSEFDSRNMYINLNYQITKKTKISTEFTYLNYLAQQAGGLSDKMFSESPYQSNRKRNWFNLDWFLYNFKLESELNEMTSLSLNFFGLNAKRKSLGFRSNRVDQIDPFEERDLIFGDFNNYGLESKLLNKYKVLNKKSIFLLGFKYYNSNNTGEQGPGINNSDPNFNFQYDLFPNYRYQSLFTYPNLNFSFFGENIFYLSNKFSITPGFRFENIKTQSDGFYKNINLDAADNVILNELNYSNDVRKRSFVLLGFGISYKPINFMEFYGNISENYRSVTFADISIFNPSYAINPNIKDESGMTADFGLRGNIKNFISYDISLFNLSYNDRIGFVQKLMKDGRVKTERGNVGDAKIFGIETLLDFDLKKIFINNENYRLNYYINASFIDSEYSSSEIPGIKGKNVEFVPKSNIKTGLRFGYDDFMLSTQYSYMSKQFTDSSNAISGNLSGVIGQIPSYKILDLSMSYYYKNFTFESGVNNLLNEKYFTRRATGYPGPGIIPSSPRTFYCTVEIKI